jgi:hypothetical protein
MPHMHISPRSEEKKICLHVLLTVKIACTEFYNCGFFPLVVVLCSLCSIITTQAQKFECRRKKGLELYVDAPTLVPTAHEHIDVSSNPVAQFRSPNASTTNGVRRHCFV